MKEKNKRKKVTGNDIGIIFSIMGIVASIILIVLNFIDNESKTIGITLLCACIASLAANISNKKKDK